jgi:hypothetical protein
MKKVIALLGSLAIVSSVAVALGMSAKVLDGKPEFEKGEDFGYFLWHDGDGVHLRWTTKGLKHEFAGTVTSDGAIEKLRGVRLEGPDWLARTGPSGFKFKTITEGGVDGVDFRTEGGEYTFDLNVDGHPVALDHITVGGGGVHPKQNPFPVRKQGD